MLDHINAVEGKIARWQHPEDPMIAVGLKVPFTTSDMAFLLEEINRGRSAVTGIPTRPSLIRWKAPKKDNILRIGEGDDQQRSALLKLSDLACMTKEEATRHLNEVILGGKNQKDLYDQETIERIESRMAEAAEYEKARG
jgi:tRNA threonylcarbamoyladenosine dehydratase